MYKYFVKRGVKNIVICIVNYVFLDVMIRILLEWVEIMCMCIKIFVLWIFYIYLKYIL